MGEKLGLMPLGSRGRTLQTGGGTANFFPTIRDVPPAGELIRRLATEYERLLAAGS